jgi:hypothetical protein
MTQKTPNTKPGRPSPMRVLRSWLFRERAVRGACAIELDVVDNQITREESAVGQAVSQAARLERRLEAVRAAMQAALTDAVSPGVVDRGEAHRIAQHLLTASIDARRHTQQLEGLT